MYSYVRVKRRGMNRVFIKKKKKIYNKKSKAYCLFFCRFGRCHNKECQYIHDPEKVAVCTRFLRGTCRVSDCPFSHKVAREKMPVCSFFLQGRCNNDSCPYVHVNVSPEAQVCPNFIKGFCADGEKCKLRHVFVCKKCASGSKCENGCVDYRKPIKQEFNRARTVIKLSSNSLVPSKPRESPKPSADFIPLISDSNTENFTAIELERLNDTPTANMWANLDYDSDDTWNDEEEKVVDSKKPLIRILPRFLLES